VDWILREDHMDDDMSLRFPVEGSTAALNNAGEEGKSLGRILVVCGMG